MQGLSARSGGALRPAPALRLLVLGSAFAMLSVVAVRAETRGPQSVAPSPSS